MIIENFQSKSWKEKLRIQLKLRRLYDDPEISIEDLPDLFSELNAEAVKANIEDLERLKSLSLIINTLPYSMFYDKINKTPETIKEVSIYL